MIGFLNNIGNVLRFQGKLDQALKYFQKSLQIAERMLGSQHPEVAQRLNNIGSVYWNKGRYDAALEYYQRALEINEGALGPSDPNQFQRRRRIPKTQD